MRYSLAVSCLAGLFSAQAIAEPNDGEYRSAADGVWTDYSTVWQAYNAKTGTWSAATSAPTSTTTATIRAGHSVEVTCSGTIGVKSVGTLIIEGSNSADPGELIIKRTTGSGWPFLTIYTGLDMKTGFSTAPRIIFDDAHTSGNNPTLYTGAYITIAGEVRSEGGSLAGKIEATGSNVITIAPTAVISAENGELRLTGSFDMDGTIRANGPYTIYVWGAGPGSGSSGKWEVTHNSANLWFDTDADMTINSSAGYILLQAGTLTIAQSLTYRGGLKQTGGSMAVVSGETLTVHGRYFGG